MLAIVRAIERKEIKGAKVAVVISDKRAATALKSATGHGIEAVWLDPDEAPSRLDYDMRLLDVLKENGVTPKSGLVLLAGFMRLLSPELVEAFRGRMMNVHPALLPSFPGLRAQEQALAVRREGLRLHGALRRPRGGLRPHHPPARREGRGR